MTEQPVGRLRIAVLDLRGVSADTSRVEAAHIRWRPLGRLLVEQGLLSEAELERALDEQARTGRRLGETLVDLGFVSYAALSHALAHQYGIEPEAETGFGTGLRAQIERRLDQVREDGIETRVPALRLVHEPEASEPPPEVEGENLYLAPLEEQWAKLAAAEEQLAEAERELTILRRAAGRRREQAARFVERIRSRDRRIAELSPQATLSPLEVEAPRSHLVYAQAADRYELVEREGEPPQPGAILELPELGEGKLIVCRVGRSPLPSDARLCAYAQPVD